jgi:hypothetical protein
LIAECLAVRLEMSSNGKLRSVDPPKSPDYLDALLLALHMRYVDDNPHVVQSDRVL